MTTKFKMKYSQTVYYELWLIVVLFYHQTKFCKIPSFIILFPLNIFYYDVILSYFDAVVMAIVVNVISFSSFVA